MAIIHLIYSLENRTEHAHVEFARANLSQNRIILVTGEMVLITIHESAN